MTFDPRSYSMTQSTNFGTQYSTDTKLLRTYPFTVSVWNWEQVTGGKVEEIKTKPIIAWKPMDDNSEIVWHPQGRYLSIFGQGTASLIIMDTDSGSWKHIPNIVKTTEGHTVRPIQDGWLALTPDTLQIMELNGELRKTFILGSMKEESLDEMGSGSGCWILANGESSKSLPDSLKHQVFFLYRRDNRVLVESYESVSSRQRQPKQIKLTSFRVSRITAKRTSSQEATIMEIPWVDWYNSLVKPSWTPQPRTIGLIWQILYPVILLIFGYVIVQAIRNKLSWMIALPFIVNLVANLIFTPIQFGMRNLPLASIDIVIVWGTILWSMAAI